MRPKTDQKTNKKSTIQNFNVNFMGLTQTQFDHVCTKQKQKYFEATGGFQQDTFGALDGG
jgi:hypothetical protein